MIAALSPAYDPAAWDNFAVAEVSAAAALAGLLVVACSINIAQILQLPHLVSRLAATLTLFTAVLVVGTLLLVPGQNHVVAGIEIAAIAVLTMSGLYRMRGTRGLDPQYRRLTLAAAARGILAAALMATGGIGCATATIGGLYWLVGGILLGFATGLLNSWVALVEILR